MSIKKIVTLILLFTVGVLLYSQPVVKAVIDSTEYKPGDLVKEA